MNNKKGFTLIEILATIVILSIVLIIAVPIIFNRIEKAKIDGAKLSAEIYIKDVNKTINEHVVNGNKFDDGIYYINNDTLGNKFPLKVNNSYKPNLDDDYVVINKSKVTNYKVSDGKYIVTDFGIFSYNEFKKWISVKDFGAVGDGVTNDTDNLKKAIEYINNNGGTLYFPYGTYLVSANKNNDPILHIKSNKKIEIQLFGSKVQILQNNYPQYSIFKVEKSNNVIISDGYLVGDRLEHDYTIYQGKNPTHEWGHGIAIYSSTAKINKMNISQFTGDGVYISDYLSDHISNVNIEDTEISYCRRMGLTLIEADIIRTNNLYIHHIGKHNDIPGADPQAGIDIESYTDNNPTKNIYFNNLRIENTTKHNIISGGTRSTKNFYIDNSIFNGYITFPHAVINNSIFNANKAATSVLTDCKITNSTVNLKHNNSWLYLNDSIVDSSNIIGEYSDTSGSYLRYNDNTIITNSNLKHIQGYHSSYAPNYKGRTIYTYTGIQLAGQKLEEWKNNIFDDIFFVVQGTLMNNEYNLVLQNNTIKNSTMYIIKNTYKEGEENVPANKYIRLNNMNLNNIKIIDHAGYEKYVNIYVNDSKIKNTNFSSYINNYNKSSLELENLNGKVAKKDSVFDNSIIKINGDIVNNDVFSNVIFKNNSKIYLNNYTDTIKIYSPYELGKDYNVYYNGNNVLKD